MTTNNKQLDWYRVADVDELPAGRVKTVTAGVHSMALTHIDGEFTAMDNRCPHQGHGTAGISIRRPAVRRAGTRTAAKHYTQPRCVRTASTWGSKPRRPTRQPLPM
jgi:hypothetical protein